jgi:hypothetical protein
MSIPLLLYFTTNTMQVASSNEVNLGEDEDPEAIRAMIRHMYDLPYDQMLMDTTVDDSASYSTNEDLLFHIAVFTAADKYDVASLRPLVVKKFEGLMETNWEGETFATSIQRLTGPSAGQVADKALQAAAAAFCADNLRQLIRQDAFVKMIEEDEPFAGRLLTGFLTNEDIPEGCITVQLMTCKKPSCIHKKPSHRALQTLIFRCIMCGTHANKTIIDEWGDSTPGLLNYKMAQIKFI